MKKCSRLLAALVSMLAILVFSAASVFAAEGIDWDNSVITATGTGVAPANARSAAQARMLARRAAQVDGYRQLAETVKGVNVDSETTVENMMVTSDVIRTKVNAFIQGARVVDERELPGGGYEVTMQVSMYGVSSLASAVLPRPATVEPIPQPAPSVAPSTPASVSVNVQVTPGTLPNLPPPPPATTGNQAAGVYTGVIVDCRGLGLQPSMAATLRNADGQPIYGHKNLDIDRVISEGMVGYAREISLNTRAGNNPIVVKAVRLENHNGTPVISTADANRILIENQKSGFLENLKVVFVR